jgi:hypothetical protein
MPHFLAERRSICETHRRLWTPLQLGNFWKAYRPAVSISCSQTWAGEDQSQASCADLPKIRSLSESPVPWRRIVLQCKFMIRNHFSHNFTIVATRWRYIKWPYIKSHKSRSVAFRSRRTMIVLDQEFIHQLELNSLYSISQICETKPTRNDTCAPWSSVVGCSRLQNATAKNVVIMFSDTVTLWVHSSNDKSNLAPDYERYSRPSAPPWSVRYYIKLFCARVNIFDIQLFLLNEKCPA